MPRPTAGRPSRRETEGTRRGRREHEGEERIQDTPFPEQLIVEVTAACDQHCIFCGRTYMERPRETVNEGLFRRIVEEVARESPGTELWPTFMGEALLLGDRLFELIRHARRAGCRKITLNSNGNRLAPRNIEGLLDCGLDRFIISCDGFTKENYEKVRRGGRFERLYRGAHLLVETVQKRGLAKLLIEMQYAIFDENEHEAEAFVRYWLERGVVVKTRPKVHCRARWPEARSGTRHAPPASGLSKPVPFTGTAT